MNLSADLQANFMVACGQTINTVNWKQIELYKELIREEIVRELFPALDAWMADPLNEENIREVLDAIGDSLVVVRGLAYSMGQNPNQILYRIDQSNLTKIPKGDNKVKKREDGKILKPDTFEPPVLDDLVRSVFDKMTRSER